MWRKEREGASVGGRRSPGQDCAGGGASSVSRYLSSHPLYLFPVCSVPMLSMHGALLLVAFWAVGEGGPEQGETTAAVAAGTGFSHPHGEEAVCWAGPSPTCRMASWPQEGFSFGSGKPVPFPIPHAGA